MTTSSIVDVIQHYQKSIERCQDDEARLYHCIEKLYKLPIKVEHLQETGIGKTVNSLRKFNGEIGVAAKALVTKWKAMVAAEEEPMETNCQTNDDNANGKGGNEGSSDDDQYDHNQNNNSKDRKQTENNSSKDENKHRSKKSSSSSKETSSKHKTNSRETEKHHKNRDKSEKSESRLRDLEEHSEPERKERSSEKHKDDKKSEKHKNEIGKDKKLSTSSRHKSSSSSSSSSRQKEDEQHNTSQEKSEHIRIGKESKPKEHSSTVSSKEKDRHGHSKPKDVKHNTDKSKEKEKEQRDKHKSSSSSKASTSAAAATNATSSAERKRRHNSGNDSDDVKTPQAKTAKVHSASKSNKNTSKNNEEEEEEDVIDGIDSSMGANFADVLGMLNVPSKKSKKSLNSLKSPVASTSVSSHNKNNSSSKDTSQVSSKINGVRTATASSSSSSSMVSIFKRSPPDVKPDLLSSSAKLEPLDPSIALELPTISTNYRPLPLNQTVMDCVYNSSFSSSSRAPVRTLTDAEAYSHGISSKTMRTKIYSGVRTGQIHQVPSLFDLCIRVLQKNIDALEYTGGVPFEVLRSVLERATPQQLLVFEEYNPYLMEDSDVLWQLHVQRNYRSQKRQEMESWREMFLRCQDDRDRKLSLLAENIKQSQKIIAAPVRKTQLAFVDSMVKAPRNVQRKQEQYGTKSKLIATPAARVAALCSVTPNAAKTGDVRLRVAAATRDPAQVSSSGARSKKAPLMAKTLQFMRGRLKR